MFLYTHFPVLYRESFVPSAANSGTKTTVPQYSVKVGGSTYIPKVFK